MHELYRSIMDHLSRGETVAHLKVIRVDGSGPQEVGASLLLREDGGFEGTIGGGAIEASALRDAGELLRRRETGILEYNLSADLGMCCGGVMQIFCEILEPTRRLLLYGGGHVAQPTAALAARCGFSVWVIDDREEWASSERFPEAQRLLHLPVEDAFEEIDLQSRDYVIVVTRGHEQDQAVLEHHLKHPPAYLGVIGSLSKVTRAISRAKAKGASDEQLARVHMPIGLDIGAITPDEIAVSIVAELIAHHRGRGSRIFASSMAALNRLHRAKAGEEVSLPASGEGAEEALARDPD
jgi:xanthine dehydrogenase accessory factor